MQIQDLPGDCLAQIALLAYAERGAFAHWHMLHALCGKKGVGEVVAAMTNNKITGEELEEDKEQRGGLVVLTHLNSQLRFWVEELRNRIDASRSGWSSHRAGLRDGIVQLRKSTQKLRKFLRQRNRDRLGLRPLKHPAILSPTRRKTIR